MGRTILAVAATAAACASCSAAVRRAATGATSSALGDRAFFAVLKGSNETSGGDRNGKGSASVTFDGAAAVLGHHDREPRAGRSARTSTRPAAGRTARSSSRSSSRPTATRARRAAARR